MTLLPVMGIVQVGGQPVADRYTYLPGLGPMFLAGLFAASSWGKLRHTRLMIKMGSIAVLFFFVLSGLSILTLKQIRIWENAFTLWNAELRVFPDNSKAFVLLGEAYYSLGKFKTAIEHYDSAIKINPNISTIYYNRGLVYMDSGDYQKDVRDSQIAKRHRIT